MNRPTTRRRCILQLLRDEPVSRVTLWNGQEAWLVTRYEDVRTLLTNPDVSADVRKPGYPKVSAALAHFTEGLLNHMDSPEHDVYRRMLAPDFMVKRVESLRGDVEKLVDDLLDAMQTHGAPVDLVASFAFPIPALVTCSILGVPYDQKDFFVQCAEAFLSGTSTAEAAGEAGRELHGYLGELIEAKKASPGNDTLSRMVTRVRCHRAARRDRARHPGRAAADRRLRHDGQHDLPRDAHAAPASRPARRAEGEPRACGPARSRSSSAT